jgi:DNA-directed RNA polymerase subunit E'/Rpb7
MFERRELTRNLVIPSKHLQRNIQSSFLSQIKADVEGRCGTEGYVQPKSSVILDYSLGSLDILRSGVRYRVRFQADICFPHKGQIITAPVTFRSKIGVHAELSPLRILLPRDLHIGNTEFENIQERDEIEFEVLGSEFKQGDENIFVLGKLIRTNNPPPAPISSSPPVEASQPIMPVVEEETTKSVTVVAPVVSEEKKEPVRRKRRIGLNPSDTLKVNVSGTSEVEGASGST